MNIPNASWIFSTPVYEELIMDEYRSGWTIPAVQARYITRVHGLDVPEVTRGAIPQDQPARHVVSFAATRRPASGHAVDQWTSLPAASVISTA